MEDADSGSIDIDAAVESIGNDLFPPTEEPKEEFDVVEEVVEEIVEDKPTVKTKEDEETAEAVVKTEEEKEEDETRAAPQSWKKEMHDIWNSMTPEAQNYVEQRESQMRDGLEKDRGDANLGRTMRDVMSPYSQMLQSQGIEEPVMVRNLMNAHYRLSTADDAGKAELINQIAQSYGISLNGEKKEVDPALQAVQNQVSQLQNHLNASQQQTLQEAHERVNKEVEAFASDPKNAFFDEVSEQIVPLINAGYSLEDAYQNAIWLNPVTRQKEIDRTAKDAAEKAQEEAKQEAEKARKAKAANVRSRDTRRTSTEPTGTMEDTLAETYDQIVSRSH